MLTDSVGPSAPAPFHGEAGKIIGVLRSAGCARCTQSRNHRLPEKESVLSTAGSESLGQQQRRRRLALFRLLVAVERRGAIRRPLSREGLLRIEYEFLG